MEVHQILARWVYEVGIPFLTISHENFDQFFKAVGQFGRVLYGTKPIYVKGAIVEGSGKN